jgi:hypothetical protein
MRTDEQRHRLNWWLTLSRTTGWWHPFENIVVACERPARQAVDAEGRLHHESEAALLCRDGWPVYAWHGVRVPEQVITSPATLDPAAILAEQNAEVRRVMIERFGAERLMREAGATKRAVDDWGTLWELPLPRGETLTMVEVVNGSPEPDGSWKHYWLRVNPTAKTPLEAIASTWRRSRNSPPLRANEYVALERSIQT